MVPPSAGHSAVHTNYFGCCEIAHRGLWGFLFVLFCLFLSHKLKITAKIAAGVRNIYFCPTFESQESGIFGGILHMVQDNMTIVAGLRLKFSALLRVQVKSTYYFFFNLSLVYTQNVYIDPNQTEVFKKQKT